MDKPGNVTLKTLPKKDSHLTSHSKTIQSLAKLMQDIAHYREEVIRRETLVRDLERRLRTEMGPLEERILKTRVETFRMLGARLTDPWLKKRERNLLRDALLDLSDELEEDFGIDLEKDKADFFDAFLLTGTDELGLEAVAGHLEAHFPSAPEAMDSTTNEEPARPTPGKSDGGKPKSRTRGSTSKVATKQEAQEQILAGDIRALYLMLARSLHPDKESDPGRREEKTAWMQKVTAAYTERDLAKLLDILVKNPLDSVAPYLSQAPLKTVQSFAKRLRRDLTSLKEQAARATWHLGPYFGSFLKSGQINEPAIKRHIAETKKTLKMAKLRREIYATREGLEQLLEALRIYDRRELL